MSIFSTLRDWARGIKRNTMVLWFAARHPDTPILAKLIAAIAVAYALSPIDLIPDLIPVLGYLDDLILLPVLIWLALELCPKHVIQTSQQKADDWSSEQQKRPVCFAGLVGIVVIWLILATTLGLWVYQRVGD
jgi:uncharacterized membrane protein YkvA (DUF1232 family)